jgi:hypothetical protein
MQCIYNFFFFRDTKIILWLLYYATTYIKLNPFRMMRLCQMSLIELTFSSLFITKGLKEIPIILEAFEYINGIT